MTKTNPPHQPTVASLTAVFNQPYLLLTLSSLFWGGNVIAGKFAVGEIDPLSLSALRWVGAFLLILPFAWASVVREWSEIRRGIGWLALYGVVGFVSFNALLYAATTFTAAVNVAMIQAGIPVLVLVGNFLVFRVRASALHIIGVVLTIYGVLHVATHGMPTRLIGLDVNIGDALMLLACGLYAIHSLTLRYKPNINWMSFIAVTSFFAALAAIVYQVLFSTGLGGLVHDVATMSPKGWIIVAYVAVLPSIIAQMNYAKGVELIGPNRGSIFINLIPVFGAVLAVVLLGEQLYLFHLLGAVFIISGIALAEYAARRNLRQILKPPA